MFWHIFLTFALAVACTTAPVTKRKTINFMPDGQMNLMGRQAYQDILKKEKLITKENSAETSLKFRTKKINFFIEKIVESGLIDDIAEKLNPSVIILFGSIRKGDSVKESDIVLFVESVLKKKLDLAKYEKKLGHKIQLFIEPDIKKLGNELANNVINGVKLFGSIKIW